MATRKLATRRQAQKDHVLTSRKECGSPMKRRTTSAYPDADEYGVVDSSASSLNKSFPQDNDPFIHKMSKKTYSKTDNPGKQRQTLSERVVNTMKTSEDRNGSGGLKKSENRAEAIKGNDSCRKGNHSSSSPLLYDDTAPSEEPSHHGDITHEEMSQLEDQTSVEEMICEEALAAALPPLIKGDYVTHCSQPTKKCFAFSLSLKGDYVTHCSSIRKCCDNSMEVDPWREVRTRPVRQLPRGVVDIDEDADTLHTNVYANDIMEHLKLKELQAPLPPHFLEYSPEVTPKMRGVLMDWLTQVQDHEELEEETLHLCVALIDRYLGCVRVHMPRLQLVGITCLLIATKFLERFAPQISTLCHLTADSFKARQVIRYEMQVLMTLGFDLSIPVSVTFMRRYLQVHKDQQHKEVSSLAYYILDLSLTSVKMASVTPSVLAASAIYLARRLVLGTGQAWSPSLAHYTSYHNLSDLCDVVNELANLVYKAPASKFQGARNKYNTEQHSFVSYSRTTNPETVESHFLKESTAV